MSEIQLFFKVLFPTTTNMGIETKPCTPPPPLKQKKNLTQAQTMLCSGECGLSFVANFYCLHLDQVARVLHHWTV